MHEMGVTMGLVAAVEARARALGARRVVAIDLVVGDRAGIVESALRGCFELAADGGLAAGAELRLRRVPLRFACRSCDAEYAAEGHAFGCPTCGAYGVLVDPADELTLASIEIVR